MTRGWLEPIGRDDDELHVPPSRTRPRHAVGRLIEPPEPHMWPDVAPVRGIRLTGYATPVVRRRAGDVVVIAYAAAGFAVCAAIVLVASVVGLIAWHIISWIGT
jgi:hypothetical protein